MALLDFLFRNNQQQPQITNEPREGFSTVRQVEVKTIEIGSSGTEINAGYLNEEYLSELSGRTWADKIDMMRRSDTNIRMVLNALKLPLKSSPWAFEVTEKSEAAEMQKKLLESILFEDLNKSFTSLIGEFLTCLDFGYSLFDITHAQKYNDTIGNYTGIKSISFRSQRTIESWEVDPSGDLKSVQQVAYGDLGGSYTLDARFLLHFAPEKEGDNFEGISVIRSCYGAWFRKNEFLKKLAIGIEKFAVPTAIMTVPDGSDGRPENAAVKRALQCYTSGQTNYLMVPKGYELSFNNVSVDVEKIRSAINSENQEMVNSALASFLLLGQNGAGSHALSGTLSDFFAQTVQYIADHIVEQLNRKLFKPLIKMNFGTDKVLVQLKCDGLEHRANAEWAAMVNQFIQSGAIKSDGELEKNLREKLKLPPVEKLEEVNAEGIAQPVDSTAKDVAFNGAQVASLIDVVTKVAAGMLPRESAIEILQIAFQLSKEDAEQALSNAGKGFTITPDQAQLSEKKKTNNSRPESNLIRDTAELIKIAGQAYLDDIGSKYIRSVMIQNQKSNEANKIKAPIVATVPSASSYIEVLKSIYKYSAIKADEIQSKSFKPNKKLAEYRLAAAKLVRVDNAINKLIDSIYKIENADGDEFAKMLESINSYAVSSQSVLDEYLSFDIKQNIAAKSEVFAGTQVGDVVKAVDLTYQSSLGYADIDQLTQDMTDSLDKVVTGTITTTGADVQASSIVDYSLKTAAETYEKETGVKILSLTFIAVDDGSTTHICKELNGMTLENADPNIEKYSPPLHFNCRSFMQVNTSMTKNNPKITGVPKLSKAAQSEIQF